MCASNTNLSYLLCFQLYFRSLWDCWTVILFCKERLKFIWASEFIPVSIHSSYPSRNPISYIHFSFENTCRLMIFERFSSRSISAYHTYHGEKTYILDFSMLGESSTVCWGLIYVAKHIHVNALLQVGKHFSFNWVMIVCHVFNTRQEKYVFLKNSPKTITAYLHSGARKFLYIFMRFF